MKKEIKIIYYILIALFVLIPFEMVNAMYQGNTQMYKTDDNVPYYVMTDNLTHEGQINIEWENETGQAYTASSVDFMRMEANGKLAFCADFTKSYGYNTCYSLYGYYGANTFVGQLYDYGTKNNGEHYKEAQVIWWALRKTDYMQKLVPGSGGGGGGEILLINPHPTQNQFVELLKQAFKNAGLANGNTSSSGELFKLPNKDYCDCVWKGDDFCPVDAERTLFTGDNSVLMVIKSGGQYYYPGYYFLAGTDSIYYKVCGEVSNAEDKDEKWEYWRHVLNGAQEVERDNSLLGYDLNDIYTAITTSAGKKVGAYNPVSCVDGSSKPDIQNIYAPVDDMEPKSCVNYLGAIKTLYSDKSAQWIYDNYNDKIKKATGTNLYLTEDKTGVYCKDMDKKCAEVRRKWNYIRKLNPGKNPKFGNAWIYIPNGSETFIDSPISCACDDEAIKFKNSAAGEQYQGTCASFKTWYQKWKNDLRAKGIIVSGDIVTCTDSPRFASCGGGTTPVSCNDLVSTGGYKNYNSCADLKRDITDPDKVTTCNDSTGKVSVLRCGEKCTPNLDIDKAGCYSKGPGGNGIVYMSDAIDNKQDPDYTTCISNNIGYSIEGNDIGSLYDDIKYKNNSYCKVYCWESLELILPQEPQPKGYLKPIQAGREFWWGVTSSAFATMETKKICWAKDINYSQFETDWSNNESNILQKYADYMAQVNYNNQTEVKKGEKCCVGGKTHEVEKSPEKCCYFKNQANPKTGEYSGCTNNVSAGDCSGVGDHFDADKETVCDTDGKEYYLDETSYTYGGKTGKSNQVKKCETSAPSASDLHDSGEETKRKNAVQAAINERPKIYKAIKSCQSDLAINATTIYSYGTEITINDNSDLNLTGKGVKTYKLNRSDYGSMNTIESTISNKSSSLSCNSIPSGFTSPSSDPCFENGTAKTSYSVPNYSVFKWNYTGGSYFTYPSGFSFIASMESDTIYSVETVPATVEEAMNLGLTLDAGIGVPTYINKAKGKFKIDVSIKNLGSMKNNKAHFEELTKNQKLYDFNIEKYGCEYDLANVIYDICVPGDPNYPCENGLQIIYRIIDMAEGNVDKVFPGNSGNGRKNVSYIGDNWSRFINTNKFKKITTTSEIYGKTPLYSIELTPTLIGQIRSDNNSYRSNKMDPYTSYRGLDNKYKIECTKDNGDLKSCTSKYITELIQKGKISGRFAEKNEEKRRELIKNYK